MIDVALVSLIEDLVAKAGPDGVVEFWQRVGDVLANRIGREAYIGWTSFNVAVREGRTAYSIEGDVTPLTDMAIADVDGDVVGYLYGMRQCCYLPTVLRLRYSTGAMSRSDAAVAAAYNENVHNIAWCSFCVFHERFREEVARNITVNGNPLECLLLGTRGFDGEARISDRNVRKLNMQTDHVRALLRNYECVYGLLMRGAQPRGA